MADIITIASQHHLGLREVMDWQVCENYSLSMSMYAFGKKGFVMLPDQNDWLPSFLHWKQHLSSLKGTLSRIYLEGVMWSVWHSLKGWKAVRFAKSLTVACKWTFLFRARYIPPFSPSTQIGNKRKGEGLLQLNCEVPCKTYCFLPL